MALDAGDSLPEATLTDPDGAPVPLRPGQAMVLFFYPKADTPGCTNEARDFSGLATEFAGDGVRVVGVSRDAPKVLAKFRDKHDLTVTLASDDGALSDAFGFWGEKSMYGRTFMGMERATVLIAADGRILRIWRKVKVPGHAQEVLAAVRALG